MEWPQSGEHRSVQHRSVHLGAARRTRIEDPMHEFTCKGFKVRNIIDEGVGVKLSLSFDAQNSGECFRRLSQRLGLHMIVLRITRA